MNGVTQVGGGSYAGSQVQSPSQVMGKEDFLTLLVTQLGNQDPLNPMNSQEFAAQLAEFSSLEQLANVNSALEEGLKADLAMAAAMQSGMAAGLIGKSIVAVDDRVRLQDEGCAIRWEAEEDPASLRIEVRNDMGQLVHTIELETPAEPEFQWDGRDVEGRELPEGEYTVHLEAADAAGLSLPVRPLHVGLVETVRFRLGEAWLVSGGLEIALSQVSEIRLEEAGPDGEDGDPGRQWEMDGSW